MGVAMSMTYDEFAAMLPTSQKRPILYLGDDGVAGEPPREEWHTVVNFAPAVAGFWCVGRYGAYSTLSTITEWVDGKLYALPEEYFVWPDVENLYGASKGERHKITFLGDRRQSLIRDFVTRGEVDINYRWRPDPTHWCRVACLAMQTTIVEYNRRLTNLRGILSGAVDLCNP